MCEVKNHLEYESEDKTPSAKKLSSSVTKGAYRTNVIQKM